MESGYYPPGAENDSSAPYNEKDLESKTKLVTVDVFLKGTLSLNVNCDSEGEIIYKDLLKAIKEYLEENDNSKFDLYDVECLNIEDYVSR